MRLSRAVKFLLLYCHKPPNKNVAIVPRIKSKPITMGDKNNKGILDFPKESVQNTLANSNLEQGFALRDIPATISKRGALYPPKTAL